MAPRPSIWPSTCPIDHGWVSLGEGLPMIGKLPGHSQVQTIARYAHLADDPVKAAAGKVSDYVGAAMTGGRDRVAAHDNSVRGQEKNNGKTAER